MQPPQGGFARGRPRVPLQCGFTLVELVMVMMLVAVITAMSAARFADREPFAVQGVADQLLSGLRLAQATAQAQRREVHVVLTAAPARLQVCFDGACALPINTPAGDTLWLADAAELTLNGGTAFRFLADGSTTLAASLSVQVQGRGGTVNSSAITIEAASGHVHMP